MRLTPQAGIMNIALYEGGKSSIAGHSDVLKLSSNENPLGPPPAAMTAIGRASGTVHRYPSTDHAELRAAIGQTYGLAAEQIICGVGSDEVLQFVCQAFAGEGDEIIYTEHGFSMYPILAHMAGATPVQVAESERVVSVDQILAAVSERTRIVMLANPANPTGTMLPDGELERLARGLPATVILVIDGAYAEYAEGYDGGASLVAELPNVLMTRTFSKVYGLGGLRIGWGYGAREVIEVLTRIRQPFNLSTVQLQAAQAAVEDRDWVPACTALNAEQRARLTAALRQLGAACDESHANFVLARFADEAEAGAVDLALQAEGILVRRVTGYGFPEGLRMTVGDAQQTGRLIAALTKWREGRA
ncbi:MAG: histidinol-phosphate transaminase [Roseobacter sp.]|nr:histidinol-phosphate transaminase [Roseobacter sp.]